VQSALQDLLSVAGLEHEDSWEVAAPVPLPQPPQVQPPRASGTAQTPATTSASASARRPSLHLGASSRSTASELAAVYAPEEPCSAAGFEEEDAGLPPAAALRLYQARLRAAQADLAGLQAALKAKEAKLGGLEKEVQQLRWVLGGGRECGGAGE